MNIKFIKADKKNIARVVLVLSPVWIVSFLLLVNGFGVDFSVLVPVWNDEIVWHNQISGIIEWGGAPAGYWGYNGTHAQIGTFGPWGIAPLIPYLYMGEHIRVGISFNGICEYVFFGMFSGFSCEVHAAYL